MITRTLILLLLKKGVPLLILIVISIYLVYFASKVKRRKIETLFFPKISVLVYAKNAGNIILRKIENLLLQNYPREKYEIIIYDNNSTDETQEICTKYAKEGLIKYLRASKDFEKSFKEGTIWIIPKEYDRKAPFLDFAIENFAEGEIFLMNDPDVICERDWIKKMVQPFKDPKVGGVAGIIHCGNHYKNLMTRIRAVENEWVYGVTRLVGSDKVMLHGANYALRRKAWEETKHGNSLVEDADISFKLLNNNWKIVGINAISAEEEVETLRQYWLQRIRWYRVNISQVFKGENKIKKFMAGIPHILQPISACALYTLVFSVVRFWNWWDFFFSILPFILLNLAMIIGLIKIGTGKRFIQYIPLYLTIDTLLLVFTAFYARTFGNFHKNPWPSLGKKYYHVGSKLRKWFFFERKSYFVK